MEAKIQPGFCLLASWDSCLGWVRDGRVFWLNDVLTIPHPELCLQKADGAQRQRPGSSDLRSPRTFDVSPTSCPLSAFGDLD